MLPLASQSNRLALNVYSIKKVDIIGASDIQIQHLFMGYSDISQHWKSFMQCIALHHLAEILIQRTFLQTFLETINLYS